MYVIKTQKLATWLMNKGFKLEKVDADRNNEKYNVYLFHYNKKLLDAVELYKLNYKN